MTSPEPFLSTIFSQPDDDGPRLVYADWLEEQGDCDRAELIRLQCGPGDPRRERELIARGGAEWAGPALRHAYGYRFVRGFVEELTVRADTLLEMGEAMFAAAPVRLLRVIGAGPVMSRLVKSPLLARVSALHLTECKIRNDGAILLSECPHLAGLTTLRLGHNVLDAQAVEALTWSPYLTGLRTLALPGNLIDRLGARLLASAVRFRDLDELDLSENQIGEEGAEALALSPHLRLSRLDLSRQFKYFTDGHAQAGRPYPIQPKQQRALVERYGAAACVF